MNRYSIFTVLALCFIFSARAQENTNSWKAEYTKRKVFVENQGQFDQEANEITGDILYAIDFGATRIYFGEDGISYSFRKLTKKSKEERQEIMAQPPKTFADHKQNEKLMGKFLLQTDQVNLAWYKPSSKRELVGEDITSDYHSYSYHDENGEIKSINYVKGYNKLVYKNLYPNIDVEYMVHPEIGIKYAFILHPGAKLSDIDFEFDRTPEFTGGEIHIETLFGDIIDHAPITFYEDDRSEIISSEYVYNNGGVSFKLGAYDATRTVVIDPWVQTPDFALNWDVVWECDHDGAGNVYIIGGVDNMQLLKYNSTGVLQWTHNTPYDTLDGDWLGALITDDAGTSYVTQGVDARIERVDANGNVVFSNGSPSGPGINLSTEFWTLAFNCDETKLTVGGSGGLLDIHGRIYDIDMTTGNVNASSKVAWTQGIAIPPNYQEIRGMCAAPNGKYYFITLDTIGYISDNLSLCPNNGPIFKTNSGFSWGYYTENWRIGNGGLKVIRADSNYVYVHRGDQLQRRSLIDLSVIATAPIPNGVFQFQVFNGNQNYNAGIDIDQCGNIYVGSTNGVYVFNSSLTQIGFYSTAFTVYDVRVNTNGEIIACGGTGDESSATRTGGVQTFGASACSPISFSCCNTSVCIPEAVCESDAPFALVAETPGGIWSGGPYIDGSGNFDPSIAGPGVHSVTYTLPCGSETISVAVSTCSGLIICIDAFGDLQVSGGVGPYTWEEWDPGSSTPITNQTECQNCGYSWFFGSCLDGVTPVTDCVTPAGYVQYATGTSATQPSMWPLQVTDNLGATVVFDSIQQIQACTVNPCAGVSITLNIDSQSDPQCYGGSDGSATVSGAGGTGPYTFVWNPGNLSGATQSNLSAGTYTVDVTDDNGCLGSGTVTIGEPQELIADISGSTPASCGSNDGTATATATGGTGSYSYLWNPGGSTNATATGLAPNTYTVTVTDQNGCTDDTTVIITTANGPTIALDNSSDVSCFGGSDGSGTVSATGGTPNYTFEWMPGALSGATQNTLSAGTYTVTVTDAGGCTDIINVDINEPSELIIDTTNIVPANCGANDGEATVSASGGTGSLSYSWSPAGGTGTTATGIPAGIYTVTVTDQNSCTADISFTIPTLGGPTVTVLSTTDASCYGATDGEATIEATGGTAPYTYIWSPSGGTGTTASGLAAGGYTVTVTDDAGCVSVGSVTINEPTEIVLTESITDENCGQNDGAISVSATGGAGGYSYLWSPGGETTSTITGISSGSYSITVTDTDGCSATGNYTVNAVGSIPVNATPQSQTINAGGSVQLNATGADNYTWTPADGLSCTDCSNPVASPTVTTSYIVTGTDANGCTGADTLTIFVETLCGDVFVPDIFSPNGDLNNDNLCVYGQCISELRYSVYNRWGELVFETESTADCWDGSYKGKPVISGVYAYKLYVMLFNGDVIEESGNVTVVR